MTTYVVDASVAIKWVVPEPGWHEAKLLQRHELVAPDLLFAEFSNILWKKSVRGEIADVAADVAAVALVRMPIEVVPSHRLMQRATALARQLRHPA